MMRIILIILSIIGNQFLYAHNMVEHKIHVCGFYFEIYDKKEITDFYKNQYMQFVRAKNISLAIDLRKKESLIVTEMDNKVLCDNKQMKNKLEEFSFFKSDTVYIFPKISDSTLYKKCGFSLKHLKETIFIKNYALAISPYYEGLANNQLFKCFYFEGTAFIRNIDDINSELAMMLIDSYTTGALREKKYVLMIDRLQTYNPYKLLGIQSVWLPFSQSD